MKPFINYLKKTDTDFLINKPHFWLTKPYFIFPIFLLSFGICYFISSYIPLITDVVNIFIITLTLSLTLLIYILRFQFLFFKPLFTVKQLNIIFSINITYIVMITFLAFLIPAIVSLKVAYALNNSTLKYSDEKSIKVAMLKEDYITFIKQNDDYKDSIQKATRYQDALQEFYDRMKLSDQKYKYSDSNARYSSDMNSFKALQDNNFFQKKLGHLSNDTTKNDSKELEEIILDMSKDDIRACKNQMPNILKKYGFSQFKPQNTADSSNFETNKYFESLNSQYITLYNNKNFIDFSNINEEDFARYLVINMIVFFMLAQTIFLFIVRFKFIAFLSSYMPTLFFLICLLLGFDISAVFSFTNFSIALPVILFFVVFFFEKKTVADLNKLTRNPRFIFFINQMIILFSLLSSYNFFDFFDSKKLNDLSTFIFSLTVFLIASFYSNRRILYFINSPKV